MDGDYKQQRTAVPGVIGVITTRTLTGLAVSCPHEMGLRSARRLGRGRRRPRWLDPTAQTLP